MTYNGDEKESGDPAGVAISGADEARPNASSALSFPARVAVRFDQHGLVALLHSLVVKAGGVNALAGQMGVTGQFLDKVLKGKKGPGKTIIQKLGGMVFIPEPVYIIPFIKEGEEGTLVLEWQPKGKAKNERSINKTDQ